MLSNSDCSNAESIAIHVLITTKTQGAYLMSCSEFRTFVKTPGQGSGGSGKHQND